MKKQYRLPAVTAFYRGVIMENGLRKSGSRMGIGLLGLLMLFGISSSYAETSFKNTRLYRHVVKRRNSQPVRLYENKPAASGEQAEVAETSSDEQIIIASKDGPATQVSLGQPARPRVVPVASRSRAKLMDPSTFTPQMPLREAVEILRNSTFPRLNISVLWKDLEENADIYPDTPIGIDGVTGVSLSRHLKSLVDGISGGSPEKVGYVVEDGVVIIATLPSLPRKMVTRAYDITDLVGQPSTGLPQFGFGMPAMGMMGMGMQGMGMPGMGMQGMGMPGMGIQGMGMQGMGMPFGTGYGMPGGTMPGLSGIIGAMTGGPGAGYGNFGTGYSPGLANTPYRAIR